MRFIAATKRSVVPDSPSANATDASFEDCSIIAYRRFWTVMCSPDASPSSEKPAPALPSSAASGPTVITSPGWARDSTTRAVMILVVLASGRSSLAWRANSTCPVSRSSRMAARALMAGAVRGGPFEGAGVWSTVGKGEGDTHTPGWDVASGLGLGDAFALPPR